MNARSIRWSMAASKLECSRLCSNLLDALACSCLAAWCPSWGKSPWLATTTTPCSSLPCHCQPLALLLPLHHVLLSCMQLLSCQACQHSLPSISSPAPFLLLTLIASMVQGYGLASIAVHHGQCPLPPIHNFLVLACDISRIVCVAVGCVLCNLQNIIPFPPSAMQSALIGSHLNNSLA
jgi:hypothetical protein